LTLSKSEYETLQSRFKSNLNKQLDTRFEEVTNMVRKLQTQVDEGAAASKTRVDELE